MDKTIIISVGGSIIVPNEIDTKFLKELNMVRNKESIQENYCSFELCEILKSKGFDEITDTLFTYDGAIIDNYNSLRHSDGNNSMISRPTHSIVINWFRQNHGIHIWNESIIVEGAKSRYKYEWIILLEKDDNGFRSNCKPFHKFEDATESSLLYALNNLI